LSLVVSPDTNTERIISTISSIDSLISEVRLLDAYENKQTFRITYQDASRNLSNEEIKPIREKIIAILESELRISLVK
jgi:phenylalanyl-tRNA synthetase beta subunit